ncbi:uncharacterized protein FIESC28_08564 [Fusarium coffeatum]|uniref:Uncharacterized protein n=1 Tax=Fusarium coffeatum TaxID=231269 RepID=A0A366R628_9HYPO|nr:uncharacterized protein FIESC28_08564 [Fusarium coffeatum]RBR12607.1 hypothetical protein FIESC28_08564 [Fusarium coffeatum]
MSGLKFANTGSLIDAKELQRMFKGQSGAGNGGKSKGKGNSLPMKRQGSSQNSRHAPTAAPSKIHVLPPSLHYYAATLMSDLPKRAGPILGAGALNFLNNKDGVSQVTPRPPELNKAPVTISQAISPVVVPTAEDKGKEPIQGHIEKTALESKGPISVAVTAPSSNVDLSRGSTSHQQPIATGVSMASATEGLKTLKRDENPKSSMASTFYSMGDSDEESDQETTSVKVKDEAVKKSNTTVLLRYSSDDILKLKHTGTEFQTAKPKIAFAQLGINKVKIPEISPSLKPQPVMKLPQTAGARQNSTKPNISDVSTNIVPQARKVENDTPKISQAQDETAECTVPHQQQPGKNELSLEGINDSRLRPEAPGFVPAPSNGLATLLMDGLNKPAETQSLAGNLTRPTCLTGQMIIVTPIQITDGQLISGTPSSRLVMEPKSPDTNQAQTLNVQVPDSFVPNLPGRGVEGSNSGSAAHPSKPRKPTKGLGSSMWAK